MQNNDDFEKIIDRIIEKQIVGHAYLIKTSEIYFRENIINFIKKIVNSYAISENEKNSIFNQIDNNEYPELEIIIPDGMQIRKDQIKELEVKFKTAANKGQKRFYILEFAENLNDSSANALLKFLEEPETDVVAFLITKNINLVKGTLISRCQILECNNVEGNFENNEELTRKSFEFINLIISKKIKAIPYLYEYYELSNDEIIKIFTISSKVIYGIINHIYGFDLIYLNKKEEIIKLSENIEIEILIKMINELENSINLLKNNVNTRLVFDKLMIEIWS